MSKELFNIVDDGISNKRSAEEIFDKIKSMIDEKVEKPKIDRTRKIIGYDKNTFEPIYADVVER